MGLHVLTRKQDLPISLAEAWDFFSSPANLKTITPPYMGFDITSGFRGEKMYPGQIITYIVRPVLGLPLNWVTEITHVKEPHFFVDEQRFGPYTFWHHKHFFEPIESGVRMEDIVHYKVPLGPLGDLANWVYVKSKLDEIFDFRFKKLEEIFGKVKNSTLV
jgi:ligand-binding SRPBCC domain-containing protein